MGERRCVSPGARGCPGARTRLHVVREGVRYHPNQHGGGAGLIAGAAHPEVVQDVHPTVEGHTRREAEVRIARRRAVGYRGDQRAGLCNAWRGAPVDLVGGECHLCAGRPVQQHLVLIRRVLRDRSLQHDGIRKVGHADVVDGPAIGDAGAIRRQPEPDQRVGCCRSHVELDSAPRVHRRVGICRQLAPRRTAVRGHFRARGIAGLYRKLVP